ncbi:endonuclease/exonuclease/phosphatase family protein [Flaviaesturariibacter aridisoli]|uniref:Endonuclease/exonuclease/phosphatase n=1 Tax=Flaviaesturariibacter aridisoli TaxID=2545761 RepID=A0A4R4E098_9BACT|nr:endonuclease/exonuclease/phosphatase family protein [Flaviaesturariibacter aridisoli]TCZ70565.1 endonuclease/exonuclease/phosphatase [Flaviaesturariibacter aridisoli]
MKKACLLPLFIILLFNAFAQQPPAQGRTSEAASGGKQTYKVAVIAFYNLENFYDTTDNPIVDDQEFLPSGARNYNTKIYMDKVGKLATVLSEIGTEVSPDGPAIIGVAEIENDTVLHDLVNHPKLKARGYQIVHYDSKDLRGVDVALLYNPKYFTPEASAPLQVNLPVGAKEGRRFTRDVLWVKGKLDGEPINLYVNHWPSRVGGEERSAPGRAAAARVSKQHSDSLLKIDPNTKFVIMGDLNDDPISPSVAKVLGAKGDAKDVQPGGIFNPWVHMYNNGIGTLAYQDAWSLFDQIMISQAWLPRQQEGYFFFQQKIFNKEYLTENQGRYRGYPMRTWDGMSYRGGYSDHFPTYLIFLRKK